MTFLADRHPAGPNTNHPRQVARFNHIVVHENDSAHSGVRTLLRDVSPSSTYPYDAHRGSSEYPLA